MTIREAIHQVFRRANELKLHPSVVIEFDDVEDEGNRSDAYAENFCFRVTYKDGTVRTVDATINWHLRHTDDTWREPNG